MKTVATGDATTLVMSILDEHGVEEKQFYVVPIATRPGGILLAVPDGAVPEEKLLAGQTAEEEAVIGPSTKISMELLEEDESNEVVRIGLAAQVICVDCSDGILDWLREYDPVTDSLEDISSFAEARPQALPNVEAVLDEVYAWAESTAGRANFYSAREEQVPVLPAKTASAAPKRSGTTGKRLTNAALAEQVQMLAGQVASLVESQKMLQDKMAEGGAAKDAPVLPNGGVLLAPKLPALSSSISPAKHALGKTLQNLGPPPKTKALTSGLAATSKQNPEELEEPVDPLRPDVPQDPMLAALTQQSAAVTALVAHITGGGDVMTDLHGGTTGSLGASTKGLLRRQKMQADLASGSSSFFLQLHQQMHRKMFPSKLVPQKEEELLSSQVTMCQYLERFGNFRNCRDTGLTFWVLAHAMDALSQGDTKTCQEFMALLNR